MKVSELLSSFKIWTTLSEEKLLKKLQTPVKLSSLPEEEQFQIENMIRKSLVQKIGFNDPTVVANDIEKVCN